jgi:hypothetical protein
LGVAVNPRHREAAAKIDRRRAAKYISLDIREVELAPSLRHRLAKCKTQQASLARETRT